MKAQRKLHKTISLILVLILSFSISLNLTFGQDVDGESSTDDLSITEITDYSEYTAVIADSGDYAYFSFVPNETAYYTIYFGSTITVSMTIVVYDSEWSGLSSAAYSSVNSLRGDGSIGLELEQDKLYYIALSAGKAGNYTIYVVKSESLGACGENAYYSLDEESGTLTISGSGDMTDYESSDLPPWYELNSSITSVVVEEGITSIGDYAFYGCSNLTDVTLPDSLTDIGNYAFYYCYALVSAPLPDALTNIGDYAFYYCRVLENIVFPEGLVSIGKCAFYCCWKLTDITLPSSLESLGGSAFGSCYNLTSLIIMEGLEEIAGAAFYGCRSLESVSIPDSVVSIGDHAFRGCSALTEIIIPDSVTNIASYAFRGCSALTQVVLSNNLTSIEKYTFDDCTSLAQVTIPDSVTNIASYAFCGCSALTEIIIPDSVTNVGTHAFENCENLVYVGISENCSLGKCAFKGCTGLADEDGFVIVNNILFFYVEGSAEVIIPDGVTQIDCDAFMDTEIMSVIIPGSVTYIGEWAFLGCGSLSIIIFEGDAPEFAGAVVVDELTGEESYGVFEGVTATAYYPAGNDTWTEDVLQNYTGSITWIAYEAADDTSGETEEMSTEVTTEPAEENTADDSSADDGTTDDGTTDDGITDDGTTDDGTTDDGTTDDGTTDDGTTDDGTTDDGTMDDGTTDDGTTDDGSADDETCDVHTAGEAVIENEVAATCTAAGSYDNVVYCTVCGEELSRETITVAATGHNWTSVTVSAGSYGSTKETYTCSVCGKEKTVTSLYGSSRYETAADIVSNAFENSTYAVIADGSNFPDALAAASLAGAVGAPILITGDSKIQDTIEELRSLGVTYVYIVGGTSSVSAGAMSAIEAEGIEVERIAGDTRQLTAVAVAEKVLSITGTSDVCLVATGKTYADALAASPYAYWSASSIYLTKNDGSISDEVLASIKAAGYSQIIILGGTSSVTEATEETLSEIASVTRLGGDTRYETAEAIAAWSVEQGMSYNGLTVATGTNYPDALTASALCGKNGSVLLLSGATAEASAVLEEVIDASADDISDIYIVGGNSSVSAEVREMMVEALK